jgi:transposase-like protein
MDEVFLTINGKRHYLWRVVDQDDNDDMCSGRPHEADTAAALMATS